MVGGLGGLVGQAGGLHGGQDTSGVGPLAALPPHVDAVVVGRGGVTKNVSVAVVVQRVEGADDDLVLVGGDEGCVLQENNLKWLNTLLVKLLPL